MALQGYIWHKYYMRLNTTRALDRLMAEGSMYKIDF